jgi:nucleotide-binding universal stress UspA family protein
MPIYSHILVLIPDETDGQVLVEHAVRLAEGLGAKMTLCHVSNDLRPMDYISDSRTGDSQSIEIIEAKEMLSRVAEAVSYPIQISQLVTMQRFKDMEKFINENDIDVVIAGHKNRFMGSLTSWSAEFINHLSIDVLIHHVEKS